MEIFKQLKELGYKHYIDLTIEELDNLPVNNIERRIECSLVIDWFREKHNIVILITPYTADYWTFKIYTLSGIVRVLYLNGKNVTIKSGTHKVFKTYLDSREEAILEAIEILTEQNQDK